MFSSREATDQGLGWGITANLIFSKLTMNKNNMLHMFQVQITFKRSLPMNLPCTYHLFQFRILKAPVIKHIRTVCSYCVPHIKFLLGLF
jgi:hypothetical protein